MRTRNLVMRFLKINVMVKITLCNAYKKLRNEITKDKKLNENKNLVSNPKIISNIFNNYFSTIGHGIERKIPNVPGSFEDYLIKKRRTGSCLLIRQILLYSFLPMFLVKSKKLIDSLDTKKSTGPNSIPGFILKTLKPFFSFWLLQLINLSDEVGIFPDILKIAKVIPLHKKECKLNFQNYRPISLLSVFSKIFEKTIYIRIYSYLVKNNPIFERQFDSRSHYSTNHALISITEKVKELIDLGKYVCRVFIDVEKAFDTVNHDILCKNI